MIKVDFEKVIETVKKTKAIVNDKELMHFSYLRYLENCIRNAVDFKGTPIKIILRSKSDKENN